MGSHEGIVTTSVFLMDSEHIDPAGSVAFAESSWKMSVDRSLPLIHLDVRRQSCELISTSLFEANEADVRFCSL